MKVPVCASEEVKLHCNNYREPLKDFREEDDRLKFGVRMLL